MKKRFCTYLSLYLVAFAVQSQDTGEKRALLSDLFAKGSDQLYVNKDSAYHYFEAAEKLALQLDDKRTLLDILSYWTYASDYHYDLQTYRSTLKKTESLLALKGLQAEVEDYETYQNLYLFDAATYRYKTMENGLALSSLRRLLAKLEAIPADGLNEQNASTLFSTYNYLAALHTRTGNYDLAEQLYLKALAFLKKNGEIFDKPEDFITGTHQLMAQLYSLTGDYQRAEKLLLKTLKANSDKYQRHKIYKNSLVTAYIEIAENYMAMDSLNKAIEYLDKSQAFLVGNDPFYKKSLLAYGDVYLRMDKAKKALESYSKALEAFRQYRENEPRQDVAEVYGKIAELHLKQENYPEGLETIKKAFNTAGNNIQIKNSYENPDPNEVFSKIQLLHLLDIKLQLLNGSYAVTGDTGYLDAAVETDRDILTTFDRLKTEFDSKIDKQFLVEKGYPIFHRMLETAHTAYRKTESQELLQLALNISEKNKDFVLLEALRSTNATQYGGVPQKMLDREAQLRAEITYLEKEIFDATDNDSGFSEKLFELKQEYYGFLDTLEINYPKYHELKYGSSDLTLKTVRNTLLKDGRTLLSYTMADDYLYAIIIDGSKDAFLKLPFTDSDKEDVRKFYQMLSTQSISATANTDVETLASTLFDRLLAVPLKDFRGSDLTIVPDDVLHYLPFDMLRKEGSYLLRTKNIGYGNSVTSLLTLRNKKKSSSERLLAFAPSFDGKPTARQDRQFGKLVYNGDEVQNISAFYENETFIGDRATLKNFETSAPGFKIIHLATHASANDAYPDYSYLAFTETQDSTESNILYIKDLYNTSLNADMVTLSACQTGIGKLQKGQGMLSLSKGFYYAGAKSLVTTLWKINDKSTVKLMDYFYEGLSEGKSKTQALREAKLKYLETTDDHFLRHPYYWAAFLVSGDVSPITETHYWWFIAGGMLFFVALFFISRRKGRIKEFRSVVLRAS